MTFSRKTFNLLTLLPLALWATNLSLTSVRAQETAPKSANVINDDSANGDYGAYYTWPEINAKLTGWKRAYPNLIAQSSLGKTIMGREIPLLKISAPDAPADKTDKAELLFLFGVHPREQSPTITMVRLIDELLSGYNKDARITQLLRSRVLWVVPMLNVDGKIYDMQNGDGTTRGADWRKNRHANADGTIGVDLNRNFPMRWGGSRGYSESWKTTTVTTSSNIYEGAAPASEPETQALMNFIRSRPLRLMVDIHSPLHVLYAPEFLIAPEYERYSKLLDGIQAAQKQPYPISERAPDKQPAPEERGGNSGISYAWSYYALGITSLNVEMGQPEIRGARARYEPPASIEKDYLDNMRGPLLYLMQAAGEQPLPSVGASTCSGWKIEGRLTPGAKVQFTPIIDGPCDYAVLQPTRPEIVVTSEYRLVPMKNGFQIEVAQDAKAGTVVPMKMYLWTKERAGSVATIPLVVEANEK